MFPLIFLTLTRMRRPHVSLRVDRYEAFFFSIMDSYRKRFAATIFQYFLHLFLNKYKKNYRYSMQILRNAINFLETALEQLIFD